jgi:hypothetical protein
MSAGSSFAESSGMNVPGRSGRWLLLAVIFVSLFGDGCIVLLKIAAVGPENSISSIVRWGLTAGLFSAMWQGHTWARWLMVALLAIALLMLGRMLFESQSLILMGVAIQFAFAFFSLAFSSGIDEFMELQRASRARRECSYDFEPSGDLNEDTSPRKAT